MRGSYLHLRRVVFTSLAIALTIALLSCGGNGGSDKDDLVYLRVFNGYPGSASLTLYGPTGTIVSDLPFGQGSDAPVAVERTLGSDFILVLDGVPEPIDLTPQLYSLYPHETATFFVTRRTDLSEADFKLYRHVQAGSPACRLVIDNALSVENYREGLFNFISGWHFKDIETGGYDEQFESDEIDAFNNDVPSCMDLTQFKRDRLKPSLFDQIKEYRYFAINEGGEQEIGYDGGPRGIQWVWVGPEKYVDHPRVDFESGNMITHRTTNDFLICMREAAEGVDDEDECEPGWDEPFRDCVDQTGYSVVLHRAGDADADAYKIHYYPEDIDNPPETCDAEIKVFSDFTNIFSGQHGYGNNERIEFKPKFGLADHYFYVLYGRPVNPKAAEWKASTGGPHSGGFVELPNYPGE